ncbi:MAG: ABC transporter ATP-binding protein, partial [Actinomycetota bacterium]
MISVRSLEKRFGTTRALDRIDLEVADNETVLVAGPNGSGKTTLLRALAGLIRPTSGTVTIDGASPRSQRARIGYLGHDSHLYPHLSVTENLTFFARLYGVSSEQSREWLDRVGLAHKSGAEAGTLSRGELQKAAIARSLVHDPDIVLVDEPFTGLDRDAAEALPAWLPRARRTIVVAGHDLERAAALGGRMLFIDRGR